MNILNFLKDKVNHNQPTIENDSISEIDEIKRIAKGRQINLAQASAEYFNMKWAGTTPELLDKLFTITEKEVNPLKEQGLVFKDSSVLIKSDHEEFRGLSNENSQKWLSGIGFEEFSPIKYEMGYHMSLRSGGDFEVVNFNMNDELPITLNIKDYGELQYYRNGSANDGEESGYDILCLPKTGKLFEDSEVVKKSSLKFK